MYQLKIVGDEDKQLWSAAQKDALAYLAVSESASDMAATVEQMTVGIGHMADRTNDACRIGRNSPPGNQ